MAMAKKKAKTRKPRKGTTKKRHKPATVRKAESLRAAADEMLEYYRRSDTPLRELVRGAVYDQRVLGDPCEGGIEVGVEAREIAMTKCRDALKAAKSLAALDKATRMLNRIEEARLKHKQAELTFAATMAQAHLAETTLRVQAALENFDEQAGSVEAATRAANPD